ncbi:ABC transporter permease [Lentibacillus saliphilus]|uniref:ABC transporter permease n=1 Tax=Lentibacillus saliphilus TaxID=2737028 RepID=UPI001C2FDC5E|nr:ABC transporter permease [Lentibacillus saliphilus]
MNKFWIILSHTFMSRFKTKSFLISTLLTLALIVGLANIQTINDTFSGEDEADKIAVIDETNTLFTPLKQGTEQMNDMMELVQVTGTEEAAKDKVKDGEYAGLVTLSYNNDGIPQAVYYANTITQSGHQSVIQQQLQQIKVTIATQEAGIDQAALVDIQSPVSFEKVALDETAKTDEELNQARGIVYIMLFLLYISVITYGMMIAQDVANEKSSRVMELLISSASPVTHMFAKIIGIALLGLAQVSIFVGVGYALISSKKDELTGGIFEFFGLQDTSPSVYIYAVVFFILGYLLYATMAAMLGSLVSRVEEVQQFMTPMVFLVMIAFFIAMFGLDSPQSTFVTISSFIPFFTPMIMFMRIGMLDIPTWEIALSLGILIVTILILATIGARIYRGGVLMYGKSGSLKDIKKALALSKKD